MKKNNNAIPDILKELYDIDPQLRQHEQQLVASIQRLMTEKPDTKFDKAFARRLRRELTGQAISQSTPNFTSNLFNLFTMHKFSYAFGGAVIAVVLIVPLMLALTTGGLPQLFSTDNGASVASKITVLGERAFGQLNQGATATQNQAAGSAETLAYNERPQSGGGNGIATDASSKMLVAPDIYYPYPVTTFDYVYVGEPFDLAETQLEVLRRNVAPVTVGSLAGQFGLGLLDLRKLGNLHFENIAMVQPDGLRINVDLKNGELYINNDAGYQILAAKDAAISSSPSGSSLEIYRPIQLTALLSEQELIGIANSFISRLNISTADYDNPILHESYTQQLDLAKTQPDYYLPEIATVAYPLRIKDTVVYDQGGNVNGILVSINMRSKEVVSVNGISVQQYDASLYDVETDIEKLLTIFEGQPTGYPSDVTISTVEIKLGTPELVFTQIFKFDEQGESRLLVPAYRFPVIEKPTDQLWFSSSIIIPLVTDLLNTGGGPIRIMETQSGSGNAPGAPVETVMDDPVVAPVPPEIIQ